MTHYEPTELERKLQANMEAQAKADEAQARAEEESGNGSDPPEPALESVCAECDALTDQLLRARAEFDNYRKRTARENLQIRKMAAGDLLRDLLPVLDNLELALRHSDDASGALQDGVKLVQQQLRDVMQESGLKAIPAVGEVFDPKVHEAVSQLPSAEVPSNRIIEEYQRGYILGDRVLRPSKVVVSAGAPDGESP